MSVIARLQMNANGICNPFSHTYPLFRSHDCAVAPEVCAGTRALTRLCSRLRNFPRCNHAITEHKILKLNRKLNANGVCNLAHSCNLWEP
jgi:hypothetical protein